MGFYLFQFNWQFNWLKYLRNVGLITPDIQQEIYAVIIGECKKLECTVIAVGGIEDHVHLLIGFPTTLAVAEIIKQIKGSSSHFVTHQLKPGDFFKWQGSYGAFTVSHDAIDSVANYIRNQAVHHRQQSMISEWELISKTTPSPRRRTSFV
ncbi:IS200/IS605 family transposase [Planktothrix agardhii NRERC-751]|nr:IS200/IS605 family transposase [Planktothrix agardhii]MDS1348192.1 IS200/IS605 family transposase [Planktothrix agardhii NRERC-751]